MADVFISYKRERRPAARHLEQILLRYGYSVWFDLALVRGADYEDQVQRQLTAAKAVIVLWCSLSVRSPGVRSEATRAKGQTPAQNKLIPVMIEPCELPLFSTLEQNIDVSSASCAPRDHALDPILDDVERLVGRPPIADLRALRDYEATWRSMGAPTFARFPLETSAFVDDGITPGAATQPPTVGTGQDFSFWKTEWEAHRSSVDLVVLRAIAANAPKYFADQAVARIATIEDEQRRAEQECRAKERVGRIHVDAKVVHGAPEGWFKPGNGKHEWFKDHDAGPRMVVVPAGTFEMGSRPGVGDDDERPHRTVTIAEPFAVGLAPVTRGEFEAFVKATNRDMSGGATGWTGKEWKHDAKYGWSNPGFPQTDTHPVVCVNWHDAEAYIAWLAGETGKAYRFLSEAEWEYCCRAMATPGKATAYTFGDTITSAQANLGQNEKGTTPVGKYPANAWGLQDVHGNVWEWCEDNWHPNYQGASADGSVWQGGDPSSRVVRGGSWFNGPQVLRSAYRSRGRPDGRDCSCGFRVARVLSPARTL
jgi:formylglycine-generating enzyme required for sulfatase activity